MATGFMTSPSCAAFDRRVGIFQPDDQYIGSDVYVFKLAFEHVENILKTNFKYV